MRTKKLNIDRANILGSNELLNFGHSIQESSRLALKKIKEKETILEESKVQKEGNVVKHDADFIFENANKAKKFNIVEEAKTFLSTDKYSVNKLKEKFKIDLPYLKSLEENFKNENTKATYNRILEETFVLTADLYKETNTTPRMMSLALDNTLTESEANSIYKNALKSSLEENFRMKLLNGTLLQENEEPVQKIMKVSITKGLDDLGEVDPSELGTVLGYNNVLKDHITDTLIPEGAMNKMDSFMDNQGSDYPKMEGNAIDLINKLNEKVDNLTTLLSGPTFNNNVDLGEDIDAGKYSAVAAICSKSEEEEGTCSAGVTTPDDIEPLPADDKADAEEIIPNDPSDDSDGTIEGEPDTELANDLEASNDDEVMDALELHDGADIAKDDIKNADKEVSDVKDTETELKGKKEIEDKNEN